MNTETNLKIKNVNEWLWELKPGDRVIVTSSRPGVNNEISKVERSTKTMIILKGGERYRKQTGMRVGSDDWYYKSLEPYTKEAEQAIRRYNKTKLNLSLLRVIDWNKFTAEQLDEIVAFVDKKRKERNKQIKEKLGERAKNATI